MLARLISTEGYALEAVIEVDGRQLHVMDDFTLESDSNKPVPGDVFDVSLYGLLLDEESWESMFAGNPDRRQEIERIAGWSYRAYGKVVGIRPVRVDCGTYVQEDPFHSNDDRVVGEFVAFHVTRLDASRVPSNKALNATVGRGRPPAR